MNSFKPLEFSGLAFFATSVVMLSAVRTGLRSLSTARIPAKFGSVPIAKRVTNKVYFGVNPKDKEEYRGDNPMNPPKAREDVYSWLRDDKRKDPEVLGYLNAENSYTEEQLGHLKGLREELYNEMLSHLKQTDEDVPHRDGNYLYYSKTQEGLSYKIHCRKPLDSNVETVVIDENKLAEGHEYSDLQTFSMSPSHNLVAYAIDHSGYETYDLHVINNIETGAESSDLIQEIDGSMTWGGDDSTLFYLKMDEEHRPYKLFMHILGTPQEEDICLFTEEDGKFWMQASKSADDKFLILNTESKETSEIYVLSLDNLKGGKAHLHAANNLICIQKREFGIRYNIEHHEGSFYMITNQNNAKNNKLMISNVSDYYNTDNMIPLTNPFPQYKDVKLYNSIQQIDEIQPFKKFIVVFGRENGIQRVWVINKNSNSNLYNQWNTINFNEISYSVWCSDNYIYDSDILRLGYSSLLTPKQVIDYNMVTNNMEILKQTEVPEYNINQYESKRIYATVRDNKKVPLQIIYNKKVLNNNNELYKCPVLLYGYGSYGACIDPTFDFKRTALLDRGVVYVIANIRGGGEMGKAWYEDEGKYLTKLNTFNDFIDCGQYLVDQKLTTPDQLACVGRSAGGLLIGAVCNMKPELFKAAVADVPFVDALNTMSDPTIPLTVTEWEEWGNPNEEKYYNYMLKYSPYDNVRAQNYPAMLITAGLNDPRVAYWEPAKWCAKLRTMKTDSNPLFLKTDMSSGHFSASDRYKFIKETAFEYAFILEQINAQKRI